MLTIVRDDLSELSAKNQKRATPTATIPDRTEADHHVCPFSTYCRCWLVNLLTTRCQSQRHLIDCESAARCGYHIRQGWAQHCLLSRQREVTHTNDLLRSIRQAKRACVHNRQPWRSVHHGPMRARWTDRLRNSCWDGYRRYSWVIRS